MAFPTLRWGRTLPLTGVLLLAVWLTLRGTAEAPSKDDLTAEFTQQVQPMLKQHCYSCHSAKSKKGGLDLERFTSLALIRKDVKPWQHTIEMLETGEMPPRDKPQPTAAERKQVVAWIKRFLESEARARAGDPGYVPLRRLSNAEYDATIHALTGVNLRPTREFPADGAAGEGFTNAAEALTDVSPSLLTKYLNAAKAIADHAVLLPDGFRFSPAKTRRDWVDEGTAALRKFYAAHFAGDGKLPVQPYLLATVRHRDALTAGKFDEIAAKEKLNAKYLGVLWQALNDKTPSQPLDGIRAKWRTTTEKDVAGLTADVVAWQTALWKTQRVGNYISESWGGKGNYTESLTRQVAIDPPAQASTPLRVAAKPAPGQSEVTVYLAAQEVGAAGPIRWHRPRIEAAGKPTLLLRDYADFGPAFEVNYPSAFANSAKYLAAAVELASDAKATPEDVAKRHELDAAFLKNWTKLLALPTGKQPDRQAIALTPLDEKTPVAAERPAIAGWRKKGTDLPVIVANSSDKTLQIPGRVSAKTVAVHPTPQEVVAVTWKSPIAGTVQVTARVAHAHPACGNGVAWWLEHRRGDQTTLLGEGALDLGKEAKPPAKSVKVEKGDVLVLAVDPRDAEHTCDMTEVWLTIAEDDKPNRVWDLGADVASDVQAANPHADKHGHGDVWGFVRGPAKKSTGAPATIFAANSVLGQWRSAAADPARQADAAKLAQEVETLLKGPRPAKEKSPDRVLYDRLVGVDGPLFAGVDVTKIAKSAPKSAPFGLPRDRFAPPDGDLLAASDAVVAIRLPAALLAGRQFVVDARLDGPAGARLVRMRAAVTAPDGNTRWDGPILAAADGEGYKQLVAGNAAFRQVFPQFVCFPQVVPTDEVVTLKMFHREDEPLARLFLSPEQMKQLDRLWQEQRFVSRQPVAEYDYLPQFMAYTTQDTPKELQQFFIDRKPLFRKHAEAFELEEAAAAPRQLDAMLAFAEKAYRRPLTASEKTGLRDLYETIRKKGAPHDEALRSVLARVFVAPAFLFRIEQAPAGQEPGAVNDWELATRLSYFLGSSPPDDELRRLAAEGRLRDPKVLAEQTQRLLKDDRVRQLAIEFGTQWLHVRGFDELKEKNEQLFPMFDAKLRQAIYEESILFFQDLFQADRPVTNVLDADYTYLNDTLAKHYGIPNVSGPQWRRVEGVRKHGRGGILGLASVQAAQSGASRTSPVLRGNWVVETLLGEKLPRPPANVPVLPDVEGGADKLTTRQLVEKHASAAECAVCHQRIDPFGFSLEHYDAIGRRRAKDSGGLAIDAQAKLKDGTTFEGIDGLRSYLLTKKKDAIVSLFCRKLLGYALGRAVALSDQALVDEMVLELHKNDGRLSAAVLAIVRSPQFRMVRGSEFAE